MAFVDSTTSMYSNSSTNMATQFTDTNNTNGINFTNQDQQQQDQQQQYEYCDDDNKQLDESNEDASSIYMQSQDGMNPLQHTQQYLNRSVEASITALTERTGYKVHQENGQRKYGPPPSSIYNGPIPNSGCEVFVGKIPRDCFEDELVPIFERIGLLYELRLMMEFNGYNRGYAFVMYTKRDDAKKAVKELNNYEIRKGRLIGVCHSVDNCRLFVGGIPKSKKKEEILDEIRKVTEHVKDVIVYPSAHDKTKNRGFAFIEYESHKAAAMARRKLLPGRIQLWGHTICVDWAEPETQISDEVMAGVKILYVRNLMLSTTEEQIKNEFEKLKKGSIERVKKLKDYAFVHFKERDDAENALNLMNGTFIDGSQVEVTFAKPVDKTNYVRYTRNMITPTSQLTGLAPTPLIPGVQTIHIAGAAGQLPFQTIPAAGLPLLQAPISPNGNSRNLQKMHQMMQPPTQFSTTPLAVTPPEFYDWYSGVEMPLLINPIQVKLPMQKTIPSWQILEDVCAKQGLGTPIFTLHTTDGRDPEGKEIGLYLYKVVIPGFMNGTPLSPKTLSYTPEEAKLNAADFVLNQLGIQQAIPTIPLNEFYNPAILAQQSASIYQGRPLSAAHGVNLNNQGSTSTTNQSSIQPINSTTPVPPNVPPNQTATPNRPPNMTDYVPIIPYYFDPNAQYVLSCGPPASWS